MAVNVTVELECIQAIGHAIIEFGNKGITEFIGDNSNGKSTLSRVIEYLTSGDITDKEVRESLIMDGKEEGKILFSKDNEILFVLLKRNRNDSLVMYNPNVLDESNKDRVVRTIGDKGYHELLYMFGFRVYGKGDICLELCPTFGIIPFVSTKGSTNMEIVNDITTDKVAEEFLENYEKIVHPAFRTRLKTLTEQRDSLKMLINSYESIDYKAYKDLGLRMSELIADIGSYEPFQIGEIPVPPKVDLVEIPPFQIGEIPVIDVYPIKSPISDLGKLADDYNNAKNNVCPTCLRLFTEGDVYKDDVQHKN